MKGSFHTSINSEHQPDTVKESKSLPLKHSNSEHQSDTVKESKSLPQDTAKESKSLPLQHSDSEYQPDTVNESKPPLKHTNSLHTKKKAPPRPPPFAATHPSQAAKLRHIQKLQESSTDVDMDTDISSKVLVSKSKESSSMENLLTSLQEFDELDPFISLDDQNIGDEMYEVVESSSLSDTTLSVQVATPGYVDTSSNMCVMDEIFTPGEPLAESVANHHSNGAQQVQDSPRLIVRPKKSPSKSKQDKPIHPVPPPRTKRKSVKSDSVASRSTSVNQASNNHDNTNL